MDVPLGVGIGILILSLALVFLVALAEVCFGNVSRSHIRALKEQGTGAAVKVGLLLEDVDQFLAGLLVLRTLALGTAAASAAWLIFHFATTVSQIVLAFVGIGLILLLLQAFGRMLAWQHPAGVALRIVYPMRVLLVLLSPLSWLVLRVTRPDQEDINSPRAILLSDDGLRLLFNISEEDQLIEADERQMIDSIFRIGETTVEEVMVPRVDMVTLDMHASFQEALSIIVRAGHSRIPVYEDNVDRVIGVLYAKDLLTCFLEDRTDMALKDIVRIPYFVPESAMVSDLLGDLQHKKTHLAVVVDEYGGTAGIVTIEDLLEEIVGEIQDEYDSEVPLMEAISPGLYLVSGRVDIDDLNRELGIQLTDEDESYTLAGIIYSHLQRVPDAGDTLEIDGVHLEVMEVTDNRIDFVRVSVHGADNGHSDAQPVEAIS